MSVFEYDKRALVHESAINDVAKVRPVKRNELMDRIGVIVREAAHMDALKRLFYYEKKPTSAYYAETDQRLKKFSRALFNARLNNAELKFPPRLLHALIGLTTEIGELWEMLIWAVDGQIDTANGAEELGDVEWYLALARSALKDIAMQRVARLMPQTAREEDLRKADRVASDIIFTQAHIQRLNVAKLDARYAKKRHGEERDLESEQQAMRAADAKAIAEEHG